MADKNITIKEKTSGGYDRLYPKTTAGNVLIKAGSEETVADAIEKIKEKLEQTGGSETGSVIDGGEF